MNSINENLSSITTLKAADKFAIGSNEQGDNAACPTTVLMNYIRANLTSPDFTITRFSPLTGETREFADDSNNQWMRMKPAGTIAALTVQFPLNTGCIDGQKMKITSTQIVTTLTTAVNGAAAINGSPDTSAANWFAEFEYIKADNEWYLVGSK